ncbi:MAG: arginine deiminase family protein [Candidatus Bathyarchaeota archaeon]|nr:arginine deiminase family protein [Candidatus Bathyarchaeota archaeon]
MWTVKSEHGRLHAVLIQDSTEQLWTKKFPFAGIESNTHYVSRDPHAQMEPGHREWLQLPKILEDEGVQVFEVKSMVTKILEDATLAEREQMVEDVWDGMPKMPDPETVTVDDFFWGYPSKPYYDAETDRVVLPDHRRVAWTYTRDTSFTTQVGTVICNMRRYSRRYEPRIVKLCYEYDPVLSRNVEIVYDANDNEGVYSEPPCVEGGDTHIVDEETIAIGVGQRSTVTGVVETAKRLFDVDTDGDLKYVCAVNLADYPAVDYMHLDVTINYPDKGKALVMPYVYDTELVDDYPSKKLLLKTLEAVREQSEAHGRPMEPLVHPDHFRNLGRTSVYVNKDGIPELMKVELSLLDFLVKEGKLEKDGFIYVGGLSEKENDVEHLLETMMEQSRGASNIVTIKPGVIIGYDRNRRTNQELRDHGVEVKEWSSSYLDLLGGPHCSTSPLWRDA